VSCIKSVSDMIQG